MTVAARVMAARKVCAHRWSCMAMRRHSFSRLQSADHDLDAMALAAGRRVVRDGCSPTARRGDAGRDGPVLQGGASRRQRPQGGQVGAVVATVGDQRAGWRQAREHDGCAAMVASLALGERQHDGASLVVLGGVALGGQTALKCRPMQWGEAPFAAGWQRCGGPSGACRR